MNKIVLFLGIAFLSFTSCSIEPDQINYGSDACHFCKMTIVDNQHASQYVTKKGKQFKYDAIECMLNDFAKNKIKNQEITLVADYTNPGVMIPAESSTYLVSREIKSPMGGFLSAFPSEEKANEFVNSEEDKLYDWLGIKAEYAVK